MKSFKTNSLKLLIGFAILGLPFIATAQSIKEEIKEHYLRPSYYRPHDQRGINVFETTKEADEIPYTGPRLRLGAGFTQQFQGLKHKNTSSPAAALYEMGPGFNLAQANLYFDIQLADGIRLDVTTYLSARHHNETWVKGGFIQFDKLPFKGKFWDDLMELVTIKIGHMEINYGDQHFRRTDGGNAIYNPFIENYIVDAFSTEIGGEVYVQKNGLFGMLGVTNGTINSSISKQAEDATGNKKKNPAIYLKAGIDKTLENDLRLRFSGSYYLNNKSQRNVLYAGDRTGSNYWGVLEAAGADLKANFTSGRFSPNFTRNVSAAMLNGFVKYKGAELFATYETSKGNAATETTKRKMNQYAVDAIYRIGARENVFAGIRYNAVSAEMPGATDDVKINRFAIAGGWFVTKNVLLKGEIVNQQYKNFATTDIRNGGKFNGYVIEAVIGF